MYKLSNYTDKENSATQRPNRLWRINFTIDGIGNQWKIEDHYQMESAIVPNKQNHTTWFYIESRRHSILTYQQKNYKWKITQ